MNSNTGSTGGLANDGHLIGVAAKLGDVGLNPTVDNEEQYFTW